MVQIGQRKAARWCSFRLALQALMVMIVCLFYLVISSARTIHKDGLSEPQKVVVHKQSTTDDVRRDSRSKTLQTQPHHHHGKTTIAFAVVITGCGKPRDNVDPFPIAEGASVLKHSIARSFDNDHTRYDYQMYAIYHPQASSCAETLGPLGYTLLKRETPVPVSEIRGDFLREKIVTNGCCGEKELLKFEAYTLTQHAAVILLDLDALILKPLDAVLDLLLQRKIPDTKSVKHLMYPERPLPSTNDISLLHTIDYAMVNPGRKIKPFQGGFVILKPNRTVYKEFVDIIREGDFRDRGGWGGKTGKFWGGQTFQGLMPYYYHILNPGRSVELDWCTYNNMGSPSRDQGVVNDTAAGNCFTQQDECDDCRARSMDQVVTTHFTVCQKPWICQQHAHDRLEHRLCRKFHHAWFQARSEMEVSWGRDGMGVGQWDREHFYGFCKSYGKKGYSLIQEPYGEAVK